MTHKTAWMLGLCCVLPALAQQSPNDIEMPTKRAFSYFGQQKPPAGFEAALLADAPNSQLVFFAMSDPSGPYLTVEADGPTLKQFGKPALAGKFRRCS